MTLTWIVAGLTVWVGAVLVVASICAAAARCDRETERQAGRGLRLVPSATGERGVGPTAETHRLRGALQGLADVVGATHVALRGGRSGDVLATAGPAVCDAEGPSVVAPLFRDGQRVGTLTAHRPAGAEPFSPRQFETACAVAVVLGSMLEGRSADTGQRERPRLQSV